LGGREIKGPRILRIPIEQHINNNNNNSNENDCNNNANNLDIYETNKQKNKKRNVKTKNNNSNNNKDFYSCDDDDDEFSQTEELPTRPKSKRIKNSKTVKTHIETESDWIYVPCLDFMKHALSLMRQKNGEKSLVKKSLVGRKVAKPFLLENKIYKTFKGIIKEYKSEKKKEGYIVSYSDGTEEILTQNEVNLYILLP